MKKQFYEEISENISRWGWHVMGVRFAEASLA
jgi:hypothetical protein